MQFFMLCVKNISYFILLAFFSHCSFAAVTTCGSGSSLVYLEQIVSSTNLTDVTNRTIPVHHSIFINVKWSYANLSSHTTSRWYVEQTIDSGTSNTGVRLSVDSFKMDPISVGGYPLTLSVGEHFVKTKVNFEDGRNCEINTPYKVESVDTVGQITSIDSSGVVLGCGYQKGHDTGASTVIYSKPTVKFSVGGVDLGSTTADKAVPSAATSICPAGTGFSFTLTPKQLSDFARSWVSASIRHLNQDVVFDSKRIVIPVTGLLQHVGGLCVAAAGGSPWYAGQKAGLVPCDVISVGSQPSVVSLRADGNLQVADGWCLHPEGGSSAPGNGTRLVFWPSCGESRLQFDLTDAGSLRHMSSGQCIHPEGGSPTPVVGTYLVFWNSCNEDRLKFKFL